MKGSIWKALCIVMFVLMAVAAVVCIAIGGCDRQLVTTAGGTCYMRCYWCFRASAVVGALGAVSALVLVFAKGAGARRSGAFIVLLDAVALIAFNASPIIGICGDTAMVCHQTALIVNILSAICIVLCLVLIVRPVSHADKPKMGL